MKRTIAITAANGRLGHAVAQILLKRHTPDITLRFTARNPQKVTGIKGQILKADYDDPASMKTAFAGVDTLLLISGMGSNEDRIRQHRAAIACAKAAGVKHIVYTSFANAVPESRFIWAHSQADAETCLKASGIPYTILRNNQYFANLDLFLEQARETGVFSMPGMEGKVAYISHADVAGAIAEVLLGHGHENRTYELTGPEAIDGQHIALALSRGLRKDIQVRPCSREALRTIMADKGMPGFVIDGLLSLYEAAGAGEYQAVSGDLGMLIHRTPMSLLEQLSKRTFQDLWVTPPRPRATRSSRVSMPSLRPVGRPATRSQGRHH